MQLLLGISVLLTALCLLAIAAAIYVSSRHAQLKEKVTNHFNKVLPRIGTISGIVPGKPQTRWHNWRVHVSIYFGFEIKDWHLIIAIFGLSSVILLGMQWVGGSGTLLLLGLIMFVFGFLLPYTRMQRRRAVIISQIPLFVDHVQRSLGTGRSIDSAIRLAADETPVPLQHILARIVRATDLGADMAETLGEAADLHDIRELNLIAMAMRLSGAYGSNPRDLLHSVVSMIRQQESARRELAAMTGETRISAWVLGLTPIAIATYIMLVNPSYMDTMLRDPSGKTVLQIAIGMQAAGVFLIWRMMRSI